MKIKILFVCMGNICRSPTAHGVFETMVTQAGLSDRIQVDSAGTHSYHVGAPPDARSQEHALKRGYDLSAQQARQLQRQDFEGFDLVLAMDWDNLALAQALCPPEHQRKVRRLAEFFQHHDSPVVPDPYQGGAKGFEQGSIWWKTAARACCTMPSNNSRLRPELRANQGAGS